MTGAGAAVAICLGLAVGFGLAHVATRAQVQARLMARREEEARAAVREEVDAWADALLVTIGRRQPQWFAPMKASLDELHADLVDSLPLDTAAHRTEALRQVRALYTDLLGRAANANSLTEIQSYLDTIEGEPLQA